jgi:hypothetical protein
MINNKQRIRSIIKEANLFDKNNKNDDLLKLIENVNSIQLNYSDKCLNDYDVLTKESIFHFLRMNNMKTNNIALYILIGIKNLESDHLSLSVREMSDVLLNQSNEVKMNDKLNTALSSIMDRSPKDIKERTTPIMKMKILQFMANSDVLVESFSSEYNKLRNEIDEIVRNKLNEKDGITRPTEVTINNDSTYEKEMDKIYNKHGKEDVHPQPVMASYVDSAPDIFKDIDNQFYFYDETSGSFTPINSDTDSNNKNILTKKDVEKILSEHGISDFEMSRTISDLFNNDGKKLKDIINDSSDGNDNDSNNKLENNINDLQVRIRKNNTCDEDLKSEIEKIKSSEEELYIYIYILISITILLFLIIIFPIIYRKIKKIMKK